MERAALLRQSGLRIRQTRQLRTTGGELRRSVDQPALSQEELGQLLDPPVTQATVSRWEDGKMEPRLAYRLQIAAALGVSPDALFGLPVAA